MDLRTILIVITLTLTFLAPFLLPTGAERCTPHGFVYGENNIIDQLMMCSLSKSFDLDLTPRGELVKSTARALVDQGLSEKTSILYAKLSGLWTAQRPKFVDSGWRCEGNKTTLSSIIEISGLSLDVVEKVDIPVNRNQHKLMTHKPCRTFDLPFWLCRQTKPIYKTIKTWVNRAYFNLTLSQYPGRNKPQIEKLSLIFTCPEHFKQKITHSPSTMHLLTKHIPSNNLPLTMHSPPMYPNPAASSQTPSTSRAFQTGPYEAEATKPQHFLLPEMPPPGVFNQQQQQQQQQKHSEQLTGGYQRTSYTSTQDGKSPVLPPYHHSVNAILGQVESLLESSIKGCIRSVDSDLSLMVNHSSFEAERFNYHGHTSGDEDSQDSESFELNSDEKDESSFKSDSNGFHGLRNECSSRVWLKNRLNIAEQAISLNPLQANQVTPQTSATLQKRGDISPAPPSSSSGYHLTENPNELLDPNGHYETRPSPSNSFMIDDDKADEEEL